MGLGIIKETLIIEEREVGKIFLPYIFLSVIAFLKVSDIGQDDCATFPTHIGGVTLSSL